MVSKFLLIGLGGSGGQTLRCVWKHAMHQLDLAGWQRGMPDAWKFLHIDVPTKPDGYQEGLPSYLPSESYIGLAPAGLPYIDLDEMVEGRQTNEYMIGWRPKPKSINLSPETGAGGMRAAGRVIAGASLGTAEKAITGALASLRSADVNAELSELAPLLTDREPMHTVDDDVQVIIACSLAGGSGGGLILDVAELLHRRLNEVESKQLAAVLYLPEIFDHDQDGMTAGALAALAELQAGYWEGGPTNPLLTRAGVASGTVHYRSPSTMWLVGKSNGTVDFNSDGDVYEAMSRTLTSLLTDPTVTQDVKAYLNANRDERATRAEDTTGLTIGESPMPFTALGAASLSLGRDRLRTFAAERLAKRAVEHLHRAHHDERVPDEISPGQALEELAQREHHGFLTRCGLAEFGKDDNQVIDSLGGGAKRPGRQELLQKGQSDLTTRTRQGIGKATDRSTVEQRLVNRFKELEKELLLQDDAQVRKYAEKWVTEVQETVVAETSALIGRVGLPATRRVLELTETELRERVVPELSQEAQQHRLHTDERTAVSKIQSAFVGFDGKMTADNPLISKAAKAAMSVAWEAAEAKLKEHAANLIGAFVSGVLEPLRRRVTSMEREVTAHLVGAGGGSPSELVESWSRGGVPNRLIPAPNELILEELSTFEKTYLDRVRATAGSEAGAVRDVISGDAERPFVQLTEPWVPPSDLHHGLGMPQAARIGGTVEPQDLLRRADRWVMTPDTAIGMHLSTSLTAWLDDDAADGAEADRRLSEFRAKFEGLLTTARPLAAIDERLHAQTYGDAYEAEAEVRVFSALPFPLGHPGRKVVHDVLARRTVLNTEAVEDLFSDVSTNSITLNTFPSGSFHFHVFRSLNSSVGDSLARASTPRSRTKWWYRKRAQNLPRFVPAAPKVRLQMVAGAWIARMLGLVVRDTESERVAGHEVHRHKFSVLDENGKELAFPVPLLGRTVATPGDIVPALLESLPAALIENPESSLQAYYRLIALGDILADDGLSGAANPASSGTGCLRSWLAEGRTEVPGMVVSDQLEADDPEERRNRVLAWIDQVVDGSRKALETLDPASQRLAELAPDTIEALDEVRTYVSELNLEVQSGLDLGAPL